MGTEEEVAVADMRCQASDAVALYTKQLHVVQHQIAELERIAVTIRERIVASQAAEATLLRVMHQPFDEKALPPAALGKGH